MQGNEAHQKRLAKLMEIKETASRLLTNEITDSLKAYDFRLPSLTENHKQRQQILIYPRSMPVNCVNRRLSASLKFRQVPIRRNARKQKPDSNLTIVADANRSIIHLNREIVHSISPSRYSTTEHDKKLQQMLMRASDNIQQCITSTSIQIKEKNTIINDEKLKTFLRQPLQFVGTSRRKIRHKKINSTFHDAAKTMEQKIEGWGNNEEFQQNIFC